MLLTIPCRDIREPWKDWRMIPDADRARGWGRAGKLLLFLIAHLSWRHRWLPSSRDSDWGVLRSKLLIRTTVTVRRTPGWAQRACVHWSLLPLLILIV